MKKIFFLSLAEVIAVHTDQIQRYGGLSGIRDINLLSSAVAMPYASFHGTFLHADIFEMAAAYAFHICQNHPFIDGNKRTAIASSLVFLELSGISIPDPPGKLYEAMILVASGNLRKANFANILREVQESKQLKLKKIIKESFGACKDKNHPELQEGTEAFVRTLRKSRRLNRLKKHF